MPGLPDTKNIRRYKRDAPPTVAYLITTIKKALIAAGHGRLESASEMQKFDRDGSGQLQFHDMCRFLEKLGVHLTNLEQKAIFDYFDCDGSGDVDIKEFQLAVCGQMNDPDCIKHMRDKFKELDVSGDGMLSRDEVLGFLQPEVHPQCKSGVKSASKVRRRAEGRSWCTSTVVT